MQGTVKKGVLFLETWKAKIDLVKVTPHHEEMWNYLYPYFKKNTGEGYYPLPRNLFKKLREHYELYLLPFFKKIGYLERAPYQYAVGEGICYYYKDVLPEQEVLLKAVDYVHNIGVRIMCIKKIRRCLPQKLSPLCYSIMFLPGSLLYS
jgi:hypothetical protein